MAEEAKRLLEHPIFKKAMAAAEQSCLNDFMQADPRDQDRVMLAKQMYEAQRNLHIQIVKYINDAKVE